MIMKKLIFILCLFFTSCWPPEKNAFIVWVNDTTLSGLRWAKEKIFGKEDKLDFSVTVPEKDTTYFQITWYNEAGFRKHIAVGDTVVSEFIPFESLDSNKHIRMVLIGGKP